MTEQTIEELPLWHAREDLDLLDLANALEHIRRMAWAHFLGDAFDPAHMHAIAAVAAQALCGEPIDSPVDMQSPEFRQMIAEKHDEWTDLCDDAVTGQARYADDVGDSNLNNRGASEAGAGATDAVVGGATDA